MAIEIIEDKENFLFNRREVKVLVESDITPSYEQIENMLAEHFKADKEAIVLRQVKGQFGAHSCRVSAFIYKTKEDKEKFEPKKVEKKEGEKESTETPATPPQETKPEAKEAPAIPPQEKKEEKAEAKPEEKESK